MDYTFDTALEEIQEEYSKLFTKLFNFECSAKTWSEIINLGYNITSLRQTDDIKYVSVIENSFNTIIEELDKTEFSNKLVYLKNRFERAIEVHIDYHYKKLAKGV